MTVRTGVVIRYVLKPFYRLSRIIEFEWDETVDVVVLGARISHVAVLGMFIGEAEPLSQLDHS